MQVVESSLRKIIHIDMDCFYAAVEMRDNPALTGKAVAVGGTGERSVLCTCNYKAREYGVHSAMSSKIALNKCKELIILPVDMAKYKLVAKNIHAIFREFTDLVEPLALDEAYLDVTDNQLFKNSATLIAEEIRRQIWSKEHLTASAGVASNKFLAKIASGWNKPNGVFVIPPASIHDFILRLPVNKLFGVGRVTLGKLHAMKIHTCEDLQRFSLLELIKTFGKFGQMLYYQSRGIDERLVNPNRPRKSLSVETTFTSNIMNIEEILLQLPILYEKLVIRLCECSGYLIKSLYVKFKFADFKVKSNEIASAAINLEMFQTLLTSSLEDMQPIRLLGIGVRFHEKNNHLLSANQLQLF